MPRHRTGKIGRRGAERDPKARFFLFCEGQNTEPAYFRAVREKLYGDVLLEIEGGVGEPRTVADRTRAHIRQNGLDGKRRRDSFQEKDRVWAVFDRDDHQKFDEAVGICRRSGIGVARSDPCFELWLVLHEGEHDSPDGPEAVQKELARLRPEYDRKGSKVPDCGEMVKRLPDAEERSRRQIRERCREGNPFGRPSTTVGELTEEIREAHERAGGNG